jgi:multiple sugar transport system substrate-binding protein
MSQGISRRKLLIGMGTLALGAPILSACQPAAQPTAVPSQPKAELPKATAAPAPKALPKLRSTLWAEQSGEGRTWMKDRAIKWAEDTGLAELDVETVSYNEMSAKQLTAVATGTLWDVFFNNNRWGPYAAHKGVFLFLDDLVAANNTDLTDPIPAAVEGSKFDGKLYGMPVEINTGNQNVMFYNKDLLAKFGVPEPTEAWTYTDFAEMAAKCTDREQRLFGTNLYTGNYYDFSALARTWGSDVFDAERKNFLLGTDPKAREAMEMLVGLRTKYKCAALRDESQGLNFYAGQIAILAGAVYTIVQARKNIEDKFEWDCLLGPLGPTGLRGYSLFILNMCIGSITKYPQEAYSLLEYLGSKETAEWAMVNQGQPTCRLSVMRDVAAKEVHPLWARVADWMADGVNRGPLPIPYNLRSQEVQDTWANLAPELMYGEVPLNEGIDRVQSAIQKVVELPRP